MSNVYFVDDGSYAINDVLLEDLALELNNDADEISDILSDIEMLMYDLNVDLKGKVYNAFADKFKTYKKSIPIVRDKLSSYSTNLISVKEKYKTVNQRNATLLTEKSEEIKQEAQIKMY